MKFDYSAFSATSLLSAQRFFASSDNCFFAAALMGFRSCFGAVFSGAGRLALACGLTVLALR